MVKSAHTVPKKSLLDKLVEYHPRNDYLKVYFDSLKENVKHIRGDDVDPATYVSIVATTRADLAEKNSKYGLPMTCMALTKLAMVDALYGSRDSKLKKFSSDMEAMYNAAFGNMRKSKKQEFF